MVSWAARLADQHRPGPLVGAGGGGSGQLCRRVEQRDELGRCRRRGWCGSRRRRAAGPRHGDATCSDIERRRVVDPDGELENAGGDLRPGDREFAPQIGARSHKQAGDAAVGKPQRLAAALASEAEGIGDRLPDQFFEGDGRRSDLALLGLLPAMDGAIGDLERLDLDVKAGSLSAGRSHLRHRQLADVTANDLEKADMDGDLAVQVAAQQAFGLHACRAARVERGVVARIDAAKGPALAVLHHWSGGRDRGYSPHRARL